VLNNANSVSHALARSDNRRTSCHKQETRKNEWKATHFREFMRTKHDSTREISVRCCKWRT
jgi:hypothetical protein